MKARTLLLLILAGAIIAAGSSITPTVFGAIAGGSSKQSSPDCAANPAGSNSGRCGLVAYVSAQDPEHGGLDDVIVMKPDGTGKVRLLPPGLDAFDKPIISPDGAKIAFLAEENGQQFHNLYYGNIDGTGLVRVPIENETHGDPTFSPDSSTLAFAVLYGTANDGIYTIKPGENVPVRLTTAEFTDSVPRFSPDGNRIFFIRVTGPFQSPRPDELMAMNADGTGLVQLTNSPQYTHMSDFMFTKDGSKIFILSVEENGSYYVESINADGTDRHLIVGDDPDLPGGPSFTINSDGSKVVYQVDFFSGVDLSTDLFLYDLATGINTRLTNDEAIQLGPVFLDGDSRIAFFDNPNPGSSGLPTTIKSMNLDGGDLQTLTPADRKAFGVSYSPADFDRDEYGDRCDNCPRDANADQADLDGDGTGDVCDAELDGDGVQNLVDNCPLTFNPDQRDTDSDGRGDVCDGDDDNDGIDDSADNCPLNPNPQRITFSAALIFGNPEIYTMNQDGTDVRRVTNSSQNDLRPSAHPNGNKIAFQSNRSNSRYEIYDVNVSGSGVRRLTNVAGGNFEPSYSPDGNSIVFTSQRTGEKNIFVMDADGGNQQALTRLTASGNFANNGSFNHDGTKIVFESQRGSLFNATWEIYTINADGTGEVRLTNDSRPDREPVFSPDGSKILYGKEVTSGGIELFLMNADGSNQQQVTNSGTSKLSATFYPDGSRILYRDATDGGLYSIRIDGSDLRLIPGTGTTHDHPQFIAQADADGDGVGDVCDNCRLANPDQADSDGDGVANVCDNCSTVSNPNQADNDLDGLGDACDDDDDNDGVPDLNDNCPFTANAGQSDNDADGVGDSCDPDDDNDGVLDGSDNCRFNANPNQSDNDGDDIGDACDPDDDNDGVEDTVDNCPFSDNPDQLDNDADGVGDTCDDDDDNDGVLDGDDNCSFVSNPKQEDADGDGFGDTCDDSFDVYTPPGPAITVDGPQASVSFSTVTTDGTTSFVAIAPTQDEMPSGYSLCQTCEAFEITTTAEYTPPVDICLPVPAELSSSQFQALRLLHGENGLFVDRTTDHVTNDDGTRRVCGQVESFSPFALAAPLVPTAANVFVSGRVANSTGAGISGVRLTLLGADGITRTAMTSTFGYFRFDDVPAGGNYVVTAISRRITFDQPTRVIAVEDNIADLEFIATGQ